MSAGCAWRAVDGWPCLGPIDHVGYVHSCYPQHWARVSAGEVPKEQGQPVSLTRPEMEGLCWAPPPPGAS